MSRKIDLRKHPRLSPLIIRTQFQCDEGSSEGYLLNLSAGGAFLATNETLPLGGKVRLEIYLPWKIGTIRAESTVVWRSDMLFDTGQEMPPGVGLQFENLGAQDEGKLEAFMEEFKKLAEQITNED